MDKKVNFAWPVTTLCKYDYFALMNLIENNKSIFAVKKIVIMGAGIRGTAFSILLEKFGYPVTAFTDNNIEKVGGYINAHPIWEYERITKKKDNFVVLISVENGYSLKKQLEDSGFIENKNYFFVENHLYEKYYEEFWRKNSISTLIMGDCGITDIAKSDKNLTNLGELIQRDLGEKNTKVLAIHAMGMRAFYHMLSVQIRYVEKPQKVVIMLNFETLTGKQHILPRSQHTKLVEMISASINNQDDELKEYVNVTKERFNNFKVDYFTSSQEARKEMSGNRNDRIVIRMNYMYNLNEDNENIVYMKKTIKICREEKLKLMFFIPPANYMYAEELFGTKFRDAYDKNVEKIKKIMQIEKCKIVDLSYLLTSNQFADIHTIDETANYEGRVLVKSELVKAINAL